MGFWEQSDHILCARRKLTERTGNGWGVAAPLKACLPPLLEVLPPAWFHFLKVSQPPLTALSAREEELKYMNLSGTFLIQPTTQGL